MVLVDTSVWISHLRDGNAELKGLLDTGQVMCHPFIIGEIACGNIRNRMEVLSSLSKLPCALQATLEEGMQLIEDYRLMGKGLGYVDIHLCASALLTGIKLWTLDKHLYKISLELNINY